MKRVVIIGGGISGLAAAHRLAELSQARGVPLAITLLEARDRFGGAIETLARDGLLLEGGPDAFISEKPWALELCRRIGLADEVIETRPGCRRSFIVRGGRLVAVPEGWYLIAPSRVGAVFRTPLLSWRGKLRMAREPFIPPRRDGADESVGGFIRRRFGREALDRIGQPMIAGIYTADPDRLSLDATMPLLREMERRHGSVIKALGAQRRNANAATSHASGPRYSLFLSLRGGMTILVETLIKRMSGVALRRSAPVERIERAGAWRIILRGGEVLESDAVCVALPAPQAAELLRACAPELSEALAGIPYESVATVNLGFRAAELPHPVNGFGFVVPAIEHRRLVGCTFAGVKFPGRAPAGSLVVRAFLGGALHRDVVALDDAAMERLVRGELRDLLGITAAPFLVSIHRHPQAMPQYEVGHLERVAEIEARVSGCRGLSLTGNGYRGLGIPDCIHQAEQTAERIVAGADGR